jgi:hypothetical protein
MRHVDLLLFAMSVFLVAAPGLNPAPTRATADIATEGGTAGAVPMGLGLAVDTVGLYDPATRYFFLRNSSSPGPADLVFNYGGDLLFTPLRGDWDGDGVDTVGIYYATSGAFFLKNSNAPGAADLVFTFGGGGPNAIPIVGDWNGDGVDTVGLYDSTSHF